MLIKSTPTSMLRKNRKKHSNRRQFNPRKPYLTMPLDSVTICIRGRIFVVPRDSILRRPSTRLYEALIESTRSGEDIPLYFNRNADIFELILDYYASGELHISRNVCFEAFRQELSFWKISQGELAACCQTKIIADEQSQYTSMARKVRNILRSDNDHLLERRKQGIGLSRWETIRLFLDEPASSLGARVFQLFTLLVVIVSFVVLTVSLEPKLRQDLEQPLITNASFAKYGNRMVHLLITRPSDFVLEIDCVILFFFTGVFILRFASCSDRLAFLQSILNWIELFSIITMWVYYILRMYTHYHYIDAAFRQGMFTVALSQTLRVVYLVRILSHLEGFKLIVLAVRQSVRYLLLLAALIGTASIVFGHLFYFAEVFYDNANGVPKCIWWAFITLSTVGYGDIYPLYPAGYIVGILCTFCGLVLFAIVIPVVAGNFNTFCYCLQMEKLATEKYKKRILEGKQNYRTGMHS